MHSCEKFLSVQSTPLVPTRLIIVLVHVGTTIAVVVDGAAILEVQVCNKTGQDIHKSIHTQNNISFLSSSYGDFFVPAKRRCAKLYTNAKMLPAGCSPTWRG